MPKPFAPSVITANDLRAGDVVYLTEADTWARSLPEAEVLTDEAHAQLRLLEASARTGEVVGVYLTEVTTRDGTLHPVHFREVFRASGPTNLPSDAAHPTRGL